MERFAGIVSDLIHDKEIITASFLLLITGELSLGLYNVLYMRKR